jgi:hypothetical protein
MVKDSIFRAAFERGENRLHLGYDYKGKILKNTMSAQMFEVNETLDTFLKDIDSVYYEMIEAVKQIKIFANPALDKYENKIN